MNWWPMGRLKGRFPEKPRKRAAEHCLLRWPQENITYKAEMHRFLKWIFASICEKTEHRHPKLEDDVTVYAGATILGNITIGAGSVIGANTWVTRDVPRNSKVVSGD